MKYRLLGKSGLQISEAALGTMTFGDEWGWGSLKDEVRRVYETYREAGGSFIDTANLYTGGTSDKFVGAFIKDHRESVVLATKYSNQRTVRKLALKENLGGRVERKADELKE
jgi:aryl-alcohol dehydrogenase-like predicted oxidoreductase